MQKACVVKGGKAYIYHEEWGKYIQLTPQHVRAII